jgi:hypothetical protein
MRPSDITTRQMVCGQWFNGNQRFLLYIEDSQLLALLNYDDPAIEFAVDIAEDEWQHVALASAGGTLLLLLDGTLDIANQAAVASNPASSSRNLTIGGGDTQNETSFFQGYIDEFRLMAGVSGISSGSSAPTAPYL